MYRSRLWLCKMELGQCIRSIRNITHYSVTVKWFSKQGRRTIWRPPDVIIFWNLPSLFTVHPLSLLCHHLFGSRQNKWYRNCLLGTCLTVFWNRLPSLRKKNITGMLWSHLNPKPVLPQDSRLANRTSMLLRSCPFQTKIPYLFTPSRHKHNHTVHPSMMKAEVLLPLYLSLRGA